MEVLFLHRDIWKFIAQLDAITRAESVRLIEILSAQEYLIGMPHSKKIEKDIYELRVLSKQSVRIFYTFYAGKAHILHVVQKKSQRLHKNDMETARKRLALLR